MSDQAHDRFEIPQNMRSMTETSFRPAREAFEKFVASAEAAASSLGERGETVRAGARDIGTRALAFAEKNVQSSLDYAQSLAHAKDVSEVMRLHGEYVQAQMRALTEQASEISQAVSRAAIDATKPKH